MIDARDRGMSGPMTKIKVGYLQAGYPELRNIISCKPQQARLVKIKRDNIGKIIDIILSHTAFKTLYYRTKILFSPAKNPRVDIIHTFNTVCNTRTPWIVTCECGVPFWGWRSILGKL